MSTTPRRIGKYELQELLGRGAMSEVWKAFDTQQNRYVAIKFFHPDLQADPDFVERFLSEAQVIASLHHPNIVQVHDFQVSQPSGSESPTPYIVMDYIEGQTLADYIMHTSHMGRFPPPTEIVRLLLPISAAIDYAHQQGIVHHNIKPGNILLGKSAHSRTLTPMLTDFGMVQLLKEDNRALNSAFYTSPEQTQGYADNERSDLYSLGVILYEMFTGTLPFEGDNPTDIMTQHINTVPTPPALINPNILPAVTGVIMRSLAKDPAARYPRASAMVSSLARALNIPITEKSSQSGNLMDPMNSPTFITPARQPGMRPSPSSPPPPVSSPLPSAIAGGDRQAPSTPILPVTPPGNISGAPPSTSDKGGVAETSRSGFQTAETSRSGFQVPPSVQPARDHSTSLSSQPYPVAQWREPITPMPPTLSPGHTAPKLPAITPVQPPPAVPPQKERRRRRLFIALLALLILVLIASGIGTYFAFFPPGNNKASALPTIPIVGHAFFISSGLLSTNPESSQGITDQLQINLQKISPPQSGKGYYAWLLNQKGSELTPIPLGRLTVNPNGTASLTYPGDAEHTDLLSLNSRFLITEEGASVPPSPSLDPSAWSYYAEFSQRPDPLDANKYSLYDHIRHLLASDPKLQGVGLTGGLDIWLFRNTEKILEWSGSARDAWKNQNTANADFIRRQLTRILAYLDGATYYQADLPGVPLRVDPKIAKVALLEFDIQKQAPPGYLYHIGTKHLHAITQSPDATAGQKALAVQISEAINNVNTWLQRVRDDALKLYKMTDDQLLGNAGRSLLDDLATQANYAFVGLNDPYTHQVKEGVVQIHYNIQRLATFDIRECTSSHPCAL